MLEQAQRPQLVVHPGAYVVLGNAPVQGAADHVGDLGAAAPAVRGVEHQVEQRSELEDLSVGSPHQGRWGPVAGPHHLPDELDSVDAGGGVDQGGHGVELSVTVPLSEAGSCVAVASEAGSCGASVASEAGSCGAVTGVGRRGDGR